ATMKIVLEANAKPNVEHIRRYNAPIESEIAIIMPGSGSGDSIDQIGHRDIILYGKDGKLKRINETHQSYDPLHYVLIHSKGEPGWQIELQQNLNTGKKLSTR